MENQFAETVLEFFYKQEKSVRLGILQYYAFEPPNGMYLFWSAHKDERLSKNAQKASIILDEFFLTKKNNYVSFELAHRQTSKLFKRLYLEKTNELSLEQFRSR